MNAAEISAKAQKPEEISGIVGAAGIASKWWKLDQTAKKELCAYAAGLQERRKALY